MAQLNKGWTGQVRRLFLASVGMAFLAKDEVSEFVDRLVAKGETAERDGRKLVAGLLHNPTKGLAENGRRVVDIFNKRTRGLSRNVATRLNTAQDVTRGLAKDVQGRISKRVQKTLQKLNLVSARDVADINGKIDQLSRKLDKLGKK